MPPAVAPVLRGVPRGYPQQLSWKSGRTVLKSSTKLPFVAAILLISSLLSSDSFEPASTTVTELLGMALGEPVQTLLSWSEPARPITLEKDGYSWNMFPRADYRIAARVLRQQRYDDWQARFAPIDLALGWGEIGRPEADNWVHWRQSNRWYYYHLRRLLILDSPLSRDYVREHSANVHIIPATRELALALQQLKHNSFVMMEGKLVDVEARKEGAVQQFFTSLSRTDQGDASCEILYVERLVTAGVEYR